jgi:hypothetical protein
MVRCEPRVRVRSSVATNFSVGQVSPKWQRDRDGGRSELALELTDRAWTKVRAPTETAGGTPVCRSPSGTSVIFARRGRSMGESMQSLDGGRCRCRWAPDRLQSSGLRAPVVLLAGSVSGAEATANDTRRYGPIA